MLDLAVHVHKTISLPLLCITQFLFSRHFMGGSYQPKTRARFPLILKLFGKSLKLHYKTFSWLVFETFHMPLVGLYFLSFSFFIASLRTELCLRKECGMGCFCDWLELC